MELTFSQSQEEIIRDVCDIQFESLSRLLFDEFESNLQFILDQHAVTDQEVQEELKNAVASFREVQLYPAKVKNLDSYQLSLFKLILKHYKYKWQNLYPLNFKLLYNYITELITKAKAYEKEQSRIVEP